MASARAALAEVQNLPHTPLTPVKNLSPKIGNRDLSPSLAGKIVKVTYAPPVPLNLD